jgi:predicted transcriptional regulator YdeE
VLFRSSTAAAYGVRLPENYRGTIPANMLIIDIPEKEYIVFEHGPFNFEEESEAVGEKLQAAIDTFDFSQTQYKPDSTPGRIGYFHFVPDSFEKRIQPVVKR